MFINTANCKCSLKYVAENNTVTPNTTNNINTNITFNFKLSVILDSLKYSFENIGAFDIKYIHKAIIQSNPTCIYKEYVILLISKLKKNEIIITINASEIITINSSINDKIILSLSFILRITLLMKAEITIVPKKKKKLFKYL